MSGTGPRVAALLTCHNRRDMTVSCIERLNRQQVDARLDVIVLDAASTDGTQEAITGRFANATVLPGRADQFWSRGMHVAFEHAVTHGPYDLYLWVNDDTLLDADALQRLLTTHARLRDEHPEPLIVVGATRDPTTGAVTYSGMRRSDGRSPLRFTRIQPGAAEPRPADTMNGNFVLVPADVVARIGTIDPAFFHGLGDFDYGLRARQAGCSVWIAPGTVGTCEANTWPPTRWGRLRLVFGRRRTRFGEWYTFARRWGGRRWPLLVAGPYVRHTLLALRRSGFD